MRRLARPVAPVLDTAGARANATTPVPAARANRVPTVPEAGAHERSGCRPPKGAAARRAPGHSPAWRCAASDPFFPTPQSVALIRARQVGVVKRVVTNVAEPSRLEGTDLGRSRVPLRPAFRIRLVMLQRCPRGVNNALTALEHPQAKIDVVVSDRKCLFVETAGYPEHLCTHHHARTGNGAHVAGRFGQTPISRCIAAAALERVAAHAEDADYHARMLDAAVRIEEAGPRSEE